jgi:hypothetical protein
VGATFRSSAFGKVKFIECGKGALADKSIRLLDDAELSIVRKAESTAEAYKGDDILSALQELFRGSRPSVSMPSDMASQVAVLIFSSLYKSDLKRIDYPEWSKIEARIRGRVRERIVA